MRTLISSGLQLHALLSGHIYRPGYKRVSISGMRSRRQALIFPSGTRKGRRICLREGVPIEWMCDVMCCVRVRRGGHTDHTSNTLIVRYSTFAPAPCFRAQRFSIAYVIVVPATCCTRMETWSGKTCANNVMACHVGCEETR